MRILGVDPGYDRCGYALLAGGDGLPASAGGSAMLEASGSIVTQRGEQLPLRLHELARRFDELLATLAPQVVAIEEVYFSKNAKTAIGVAQARGVLLERSVAAGLAVAEYGPTVVKSQLTGNGAADKQQVAYMVRQWFKLPEQLRLDDELDAIAVALCHCQLAGSRIPAGTQGKENGK